MHYDREKACDTLVLFEGRDGKSYLINMDGTDVHVWPHSGFPVEMLDPELTGGRLGHVLCQKEPESFFNQTLLELDWDGKVVWEWGAQAPGGKAGQNHDLARIPNGNTLVMSKASVAREDLSATPFLDQPLYEVSSAGDIVWSWLPSDHILELGFERSVWRHLLADVTRKRPFLFGLNNMAPLGLNRWYRDGDERFHPDNLMIDSREANFIAIIEKKTGHVVWRLGPDYPATQDFSKRSFAGECPRPVDLISGQHDAHLIPEGLPGAGNILVFDNNAPAGLPPSWLQMFPGSRVLEIDPLTKQIVWQYDASKSGQPYWGFFSSFISSARRLANGNTLICEGMNGRLFQVTREGEIVWEFVNPHFGHWTQQRIINFGGGYVNWIYRAQPIPREWISAR